jgi:hypothetical protein
MTGTAISSRINILVAPSLVRHHLSYRTVRWIEDREYLRKEKDVENRLQDDGTIALIRCHRCAEMLNG